MGRTDAPEAKFQMLKEAQSQICNSGPTWHRRIRKQENERVFVSRLCSVCGFILL